LIFTKTNAGSYLPAYAHPAPQRFVLVNIKFCESIMDQLKKRNEFEDLFLRNLCHGFVSRSVNVYAYPSLFYRLLLLKRISKI